MLFGIIGAGLLVTLPVLPLRFLGVPGPDIPADLAKFAQGIFGKLQGQPAAQVEQQQKTATASVADVSAVDKAEQTLLGAIQLRPDDPSLYNQLGIIYAGSGDYEKALSNLQKAIECARTKIHQLADSEVRLRAQGQSDQAAQALLERSKLNVELSAAHSSLARVYDQLGQHPKVVAQLEQLNKDIDFGTSLSARAAAAGIGSGAAAAASHKLSQQVLGMLARAEAFYQAKKLPEALQQYKQVAEIDPLAALAHQRIGQIASAQGNTYLALHELEIASRLQPSDATIHNDLGLAYKADEQNDKAVESFERALSVDPKFTDAAFNLGNLLCSMGRLKAAEDAFHRVTRIAPESALAHSNLATVLSMSGDYSSAICEFQEALRISPDLAAAHYGLGVAFFHLNRYPNSIKELRRALALNPQLSDARTKIDIAYKQCGMKTSMQ